MKIQQLKRTHSYNNIHQSGRSMVEILGTLAVMGVLSIGGIMGYSYGMDRYKVNATINDINLRMMDLITQTINHPNSDIKLSNEWGNKGTIYPMDISEIIYDDGTSEYALEVNDVPKQVCEMVFNDLISSYSIEIGENHYDNIIGISDNVCDEENTMLFYPQKCSGKDENGNCIVCADGLEWFDSVGECRLPNGCPEDYPALRPYCGETVCKKCEAPAYLKDGECVCEGFFYLESSSTKVSTCKLCDTTSTYAEDGKCKCRPGYIKLADCPDTTSCKKCISPAYEENGVCKCPEGYIKASATTCFKCPDNSTPNAQNTKCECDNGKTIEGGTCENPVISPQIAYTCGTSGVYCVLPGCESCIYPAEN